MPAPVRPLLIPGAHVLRRHDGRLQVGLDPRTAVVLPSDPATTAVLHRLDGSVAPEGCAPLELLADAGLLVDEHAVIPLLGAAAPAEAARVCALVRTHRDHALAVGTQRAQRPLVLAGFGAGGDALVAQATALLVGAGLALSSGSAVRSSEPAPELGLLVGVGEPDRELLDAWMRRRLPHLIVRLTEGVAHVGPFVDPGQTACLRCIDAHHTDADPTWPLLVRQYAAACCRPRPDGTPEPVDPLLATLALAWAARDAATWAESGRPSLWSTVLSLTPALHDVESRTWTRHPGCGCSWQEPTPPAAPPP